MEMTKFEAIEFFSILFYGDHHIPLPIKECGDGWSVNLINDMATTDFNNLTRLVILAHDKCVRAELSPNGRHGMRLAIHKRQREGTIQESHPTLEFAIDFNREKMAQLAAKQKPVDAGNKFFTL